jgi:hypothetical protein
MTDESCTMPIRLLSSTVDARPSVVALTWTPSEALPEDGTVTLTTTFTNAAGTDVRLLGFKIIDGRVTHVYWTDLTVGGMTYYADGDVSPQMARGVWTLGLPREALGEISDGQWRAALTHDDYTSPDIVGQL